MNYVEYLASRYFQLVFEYMPYTSSMTSLMVHCIQQDFQVVFDCLSDITVGVCLYVRIVMCTWWPRGISTGISVVIHARYVMVSLC